MKTREKPKICFTCVYFNVNYSQPPSFFFLSTNSGRLPTTYNCPDLELRTQ